MTLAISSRLLSVQAIFDQLQRLFLWDGKCLRTDLAEDRASFGLNA
jgi:hypothetical protein